MGELSKIVWEVATVLWPNSRYLSFGGERINGCSPLVIRAAVRGANGRFKVVKVVLRVAYVDGRIVEKDVIGAINIGLKYLSSDGSPVALGSIGAHECR